MTGRGPVGWDERYRARGADPGEPEPAVVAAVTGLPPGRAVDLGAGRGRHALWLAERGWSVTAVDFSAVGVGQGRAAAAHRRLAVDWAVADVRGWSPPPSARPVDLVLAARIRLDAEVLQAAGGWLAPGGRLVVLGHAEPGSGGPHDPALLHSRDSMLAAAEGLQVERLEEVARGEGRDLLLVALRPGVAAPAG